MDSPWTLFDVREPLPSNRAILGPSSDQIERRTEDDAEPGSGSPTASYPVARQRVHTGAPDARGTLSLAHSPTVHVSVTTEPSMATSERVAAAKALADERVLTEHRIESTRERDMDAQRHARAIERMTSDHKKKMAAIDQASKEQKATQKEAYTRRKQELSAMHAQRMDDLHRERSAAAEQLYEAKRDEAARLFSEQKAEADAAHKQRIKTLWETFERQLMDKQREIHDKIEAAKAEVERQAGEMTKKCLEDCAPLFLKHYEAMHKLTASRDAAHEALAQKIDHHRVACDELLAQTRLNRETERERNEAQRQAQLLNMEANFQNQREMLATARVSLLARAGHEERARDILRRVVEARVVEQGRISQSTSSSSSEDSDVDSSG